LKIKINKPNAILLEIRTKNIDNKIFILYCFL
jgi:hypothetical protein